MADTAAWIWETLEPRLDEAGREFLRKARAEIRGACDDGRFCGLISLGARHVTTDPLAPTFAQLCSAEDALPGWNPERWSQREAARILLVLSRADLATDTGAFAIESAFAFADLGESCALYKSLAHLPKPERFAKRAAEGARTNIRAVFESAVCDTPYPARWFDDVAWRQCVIKALFVEAPLWRVSGLDGRLDPELARMALDLAEERRSAGRHVNPQLWLALGEHAGERGVRALFAELEEGTPHGRAAAALGLGRLDPAARARVDFEALLAAEQDPLVRESLVRARAGGVDPLAFQPFDGPVPKVV